MTGNIGPEYRRLMDEIRSKITSGVYPVGEPIPSTSRLAEQAGRSIPVVRRAITQLEADGILEGHPGLGVFVKAMPEDVASERQDIKTLSEQVAELQQQIRDLAGHGAASGDLTELLTRVGRIEGNLIDLYGKLGYDYPQGRARDGAKATARRGRAR